VKQHERIVTHGLLIAAAALCLAGCTEGHSSDTFIALPADFEPFRSWPRHFLGDGPLEGHPAGPRYGYVKRRPGASAYPVGAIIVKTVERGTTPQDWDIFGMAKRGGDYNSGGAAQWEFFTLRINDRNVPVILESGTNPSDGDTDGGTGHGYTDTNNTGVTCNRCHGGSATAHTDHILSPLLQPGAP
jgi:hypothetical protein